MGVDTKTLLAAIDAARQKCYGTDESSNLGQRRTKALEAYLGLNTNPAPEGRSQVVDRSVYETIATLKPSLVRIFAGSSDEVCKFVPVGPDDELGAEQTTAVISHVVTQQNPWEQIFRDWSLDSMTLNNGYAMAYWDESKNVIRERYEKQSDDQMTALLADKDIRVIEHTEEVDEQGTADAIEAWKQAMQQWQPAAAQAQQAGQPPPPQPQRPQALKLHDLTIEREENKGKCCISVLPPEHCYVSWDTPNWMLRDCPYFEFKQQKTIAELQAMGLDVPVDVSDEEDQDVEEDRARDRFNEDHEADDSKGVMRLVWARMIWIRGDFEGDDISRLYQCILVGRTPFSTEPVSRIPVSSMTPDPMPHRHIGLSTAEIVMDLQNVKTAVKRGGLDNLYLANSPRFVVSDKINLDDMLDSRPGGLVRMRDGSMPGDGHVFPLVHPFAFQEIIGSLEYFDQERQNRTGASRYFAGTDAGAINKTASGTIALQNMAAMRVEDTARAIAPAVEELFSIVHEIVSKHQNKALAIKLKGQWVTVDPQAWRTKRDVRISVGVGAGNKESMMAQLQGVLGAQMQVGLPLGLATRESIHATNTEILKLAGFANPERFWPDPQQLPTPQPQPNPEQIKQQTELQKTQMQGQLEGQKLQMEQASKDKDAEREMQLESARMQMEQADRQRESAMKIEEERRKAEYQALNDDKQREFERWKTEFEGAIKLQIAGLQDQTARETAKPQNDDRYEQLSKSFEEMRAENDSPAELIRGKDGRAEAVRRGNRVRKVVRGPDGRAVGLQ